jgi:hypothetical protein
MTDPHNGAYTVHILRPKATIETILWIELILGAISILLMQYQSIDTAKITILYSLLLLVILVLNQCLTDILPLAVERSVPCLCGI